MWAYYISNFYQNKKSIRGRTFKKLVLDLCIFDKNISKISTNRSGYSKYPAVGNSERQPELIDPSIISYCRNYNGGSVRILNKLEYYLNNPNTEAVAITNQNKFIYFNCR